MLWRNALTGKEIDLNQRGIAIVVLHLLRTVEQNKLLLLSRISRALLGVAILAFSPKKYQLGFRYLDS